MTAFHSSIALDVAELIDFVRVTIFFANLEVSVPREERRRLHFAPANGQRTKKKTICDPDCTWNTMPKWTHNILSSIPSSAVSSVFSYIWHSCVILLLFIHTVDRILFSALWTLCGHSQCATQQERYYLFFFFVVFFFFLLSYLSFALFLCSLKNVWNHFSISRELHARFYCYAKHIWIIESFRVIIAFVG